MTIAIRIVLALCALFLFVMLASVVRADDMEAMLRKHYFEAVKSVELIDGRTVNCCGEPDATLGQILGKAPDGRFIVKIVDLMKSKYGKIGDIVLVPPGLITRKLYSPFRRPVLFINSQNIPWCLSFSSGG